MIFCESMNFNFHLWGATLSATNYWLVYCISFFLNHLSKPNSGVNDAVQHLYRQGKPLSLLFFLNLRTFVVKHSDEFRTVEHRILVALVKGDGIVRTGTRAELAEHARAQVVFILYQAFFLFAVFCFVKLARHFDSAVRTCHLAKAATHAFVLILLVVRHDERTAEAIEHHVRVAVFGVLLRNFRR